MTTQPHACNAVDDDSFECEGCSFTGNLSEAVEHVVSNQFVVRS